MNSALSEAKDDSFVTMVYGEEMAILLGDSPVLLQSTQMPDCCDVSYDARNECSRDDQEQSEYVYGTRRWLKIPMQSKKDKKWKLEYFLVDTGSPHSFLRYPELYENITQTGEGESATYKTSLLGVKMMFQESKYAPNKAVYNINLIGTDFLNEFFVCDDYLSRKLSLFRRFNPGIHQEI
jgi:hypothetical protein